MAILSGGLKALLDLEICLGGCITLTRIFEQNLVLQKRGA